MSRLPSLNFKLFGIPVQVQAGFLILGLLFLSWVKIPGAAVELLLWAFMAVLVHELGHAWAYRRYGMKPRIALYMLGGVASAKSNPEQPPTPGQLLFIAFAGPLASILLGVGLLGLIMLAGELPHLFLTEEQAQTFPLFFSFGWGILNLIPILPLDGGQMLLQALSTQKNWPAEKITIWISLVLGGLLGIYLLVQGEWWNAMLVALLFSSNFQRLKQSKDDGLNPQVENIQQLIREGKIEAGKTELKRLLDSAETAAFRGWAMQTLAVIYAREGNQQALFSLAEYEDYEEHLPEIKAQKMREEEGIEAAYTYARKRYAIAPSGGLGMILIDLLAERAASIPSSSRIFCAFISGR
ncbi:MAG: site-2 protease family protein, partial [Bacteroidota bacterium]